MPRRAVLPAGVSSASFARALAQLSKVVGSGHVLTDREALLPYEKLMLAAPADEYAPSGAILAATVEQVQGVLAVCNKYRVPLWPISTGRNFGYGGALPATRGQLILDLKRMDRILDVDPVLSTALVEPGVTYQQLHDHIAERNLPLWLDFPGGGPLVGPLGNTLERGTGSTPYADHFAHACGMEVVLADGRILRTGMGSLPGTHSWQAYRYGYGPHLDGLFTQSNFAVVTKLGLWLMPAPASYRTILVQYSDDSALERAVDTIRPLRLAGTIANPCALSNAGLALTAYMRRAELYQNGGAIPDNVVLAAARQHGIDAWNLTFTLYGTVEQIAPNLEIVTRAFEMSGGRVDPDYHDPSQVNELNLEAFRLLDWVGGGGLVWLDPVSAARGADAARQRDIARSVLGRHGFDYLAAPTVYGRDLHHLIALVFDHGDPQALQRARTAFRELAAAFLHNGYGLCRTGIDYMTALANAYGDVNVAVNRAIKHALDPNGILAPGKAGIR